MSDIAVVRRIVKRLAAVQERMGLYIVTLQGTVSSLSKSPAVHVPPRKMFAKYYALRSCGALKLRVCPPTSALALS